MKIILKQLLITLIALFLIFGCAANSPNNDAESREEMGEDVDDLFGIPEDEESSAPSDDEAEVLRLLGISKEEASEQTSEEIEPTEEATELNDEINRLENRLDQKDSEISNLKSEIALKDQKIDELQSSLEQTPRPESYSAATGSFKEQYNIALSEYNSRNYKSAISRFQDLLARDYNNSLSDNCQYWIGESYYGLGNFNQAIVEFTKVFSFSKSNKFDDAQLKLGLCYYRLGDKEKAREEFSRLVSDYPNSEYVSKAQQYLSQL
ncbi:tetratricopeptide repeat protein [candidate division KSB1 bacterium]|nr:tetratricopeptide repeat protein [candidate division KSB1 bacterium]